MKMKVCSCLSLIFASFLLQAANGAVLDHVGNKNQSSNINLSKALKTLLIEFQRIMPCGYAPLKIPVLAPFFVDRHIIKHNNSHFSVDGNVSNFWITGLNNFRILGDAFNATTNRLSYDIIFPEVQVLGEYNIGEKVNIAGFPAHFLGKGLLNNKIEDLRFVGEFALSSSSKHSNSLNVTDFKLHFYLGDIMISNWNNLCDIPTNNFINKFTSEFILMWVQLIQSKMDGIYARYVVPGLNHSLKNVTMPQLIDHIVTLSMKFAMANCTVA